MTVVSGPPGTGKTHTAAAIAIDLVLHGSSVLVAAHSDHAIDAIVEMLSRHPSPRYLRFGSKRDRTSVADALSAGLPAHIPSAVAEVTRNLDAASTGVRDTEVLLRRRIEVEEQFELRLRSEARSTPSHLGEHDLVGAERLVARYEGIAGLLSRSRAERVVRRLQKVVGTHEDIDALMALVRARRSELDADRLVEGGGSSFVSNFSDLEDAEAGLRRSTEALVGLARRASREARTSVAILATALRAGRGSRRRMLRDLGVEGLVEVLPLWLGTLEEVDDTLPTVAGLFDVVIFDEASQINQVRALSALARAKRCVVVGDPKQLRHISFVSDSQVESALTFAGLDKTDPLVHVRRNSLFDVAAAAAPVVVLTEHFRSLPHLIEFSNQRFYEGRLRLMTRRRDRGGRRHPRPDGHRTNQ